MNGHQVEALIDTGAGVTVVNKALVNAYKLPIDRAKSGYVIFANDQTLDVQGVVDLTLQIDTNPVRLHALYVPDVTYQLIIGTNVLYASGVQLSCGGRVF